MHRDALYGDDLARIHDAGFAELAEAAARMALDYAPRGGQIEELGCGSGVTLEHLAAHGLRVGGSDLSPAMIALAAARLHDAGVVPSRLVVADALDDPVPACDGVLAIGEVFGYATAAGACADIVPTWQRIHAALPVGGFLLFDVPSRARVVEPYRAERSGEGWRVEIALHAEDGCVVRQFNTTRAQRTVSEVHRIRMFEPDWVIATLEPLGFAVDPLGGYDDFGFTDGWDGYLATKR